MFIFRLSYFQVIGETIPQLASAIEKRPLPRGQTISGDIQKVTPLPDIRTVDMASNCRSILNLVRVSYLYGVEFSRLCESWARVLLTNKLSSFRSRWTNVWS